MKQCCICLGVTIKQNIVIFRGHLICLHCFKICLEKGIVAQCKNKSCQYDPVINFNMQEMIYGE